MKNIIFGYILIFHFFFRVRQFPFITDIIKFCITVCSRDLRNFPTDSPVRAIWA
jgi:hypothetical protein